MWGHPQSAMHMAAARLGCIRAMVGTRWTNLGVLINRLNVTTILRHHLEVKVSSVAWETLYVAMQWPDL